MCDDAPLSPNHYSSSSALLLSENYLQNMAPIKMLSMSSPFSLSLDQQSNAPWPFFPQFWHSPLKSCFYFFIWPSNRMLCGHIFHNYYTCPWRTFSCFDFFIHILVLEPSLLVIFLGSCVPNSVFHNQRIYFLKSFYAIFDMLTLKYTLTHLYYYGKTSNTCVFISSSSFSYFSLIFLNFKSKIYNSLKHMS